MSQLKRILLLIVLPAIAPLIYPIDWLKPLGLTLVFVAGIIIALGVFINLGRSTALTLMIFVMGFNAIIRLLMFFPHILNTSKQVDFPFILTSIISFLLCEYLMLRLDQVDVRGLITT